MNSISYIIPSCNNSKSTISTVDSIIKSFLYLNKKYSFDIIIIDDFSSIENFEKLQNECKKFKFKNKIKIFRNKKNKGFALSCLVGAKKSKNNYLKIMHSGDIEKSKDLRRYLLLINNELIYLMYHLFVM